MSDNNQPTTLTSLSEDVIESLGTQCLKCGKETFIPSFSKGQVLYTCSSCGYTETFVSNIKPEVEVSEDFRALFEQFIIDMYENSKEFLGNDSARFFNSPATKKTISAIRAKVKSTIQSGEISLEDMKRRLYENSMPHITEVLIPAFQASVADGKEFTSQWLKFYQS